MAQIKRATNFRFHVSGGPLGSGTGFTRVSGLSEALEFIEYREGNTEDNTRHLLPGIHSGGEVSLERGVTGDSSMKSWFDETKKTGPPAGKSIVVKMFDHYGQAIRDVTLHECVPVGYEMSDLNAGSSEVLMETLKLRFEELETA